MMRQMALLLSLAVGLAGYGQEPADQEEKAVNAILQLGGRVTRDENLPGRPVVKVDLGLPRITDAGLKDLKELKGLRELWLDSTKITDAGLKELKELKELERLELSSTKVTDAGLKELKQALPKTQVFGP